MKKSVFTKVIPTMFCLGLAVGACTDKATPASTELAADASAEAAKASEKVLPDSIEAALKSDYRKEENKLRDVYRHPKETLEFFGLDPKMKLVEISPGGGWYSEILTPLMSKQGTFIAAIPPAGNSEYLKKNEAAYKDWLSKNPDLKAQVVEFVPGKPLDIGEPADMIVTFRNVHNWMMSGSEEKAFQTFYDSLRPGGVLGVVEHRANPKGKVEPKGKSGYVLEKDVIRWASKAGFKLDKTSEINANPKDTKNYPKGVWTLPPSLAEGDKDKDKYLAIGESDRMTLRFIKPEPKSKAKKSK